MCPVHVGLRGGQRWQAGTARGVAGAPHHLKNIASSFEGSHHADNFVDTHRRSTPLDNSPVPPVRWRHGSGRDAAGRAPRRG